MNENEKDKLKKEILKKFEVLNRDEISEMLGEVIYGLRNDLQFELVGLMYQITYHLYKDLDADFLLLRKNVSENLTLNKEYSKEELEKSRDQGTGFYERRTMKNIKLAATRFGKENFPIHMPQTEKLFDGIEFDVNDTLKASEEKNTLVRLKQQRGKNE